MALTVVTGLNALTTGGLDVSIIRTKFNSDEELPLTSTLWTVTSCGAYPGRSACGYPRQILSESDYTTFSYFQFVALHPGFQNIRL
jgi:hypothetical protein